MFLEEFVLLAYFRLVASALYSRELRIPNYELKPVLYRSDLRPLTLGCHQRYLSLSWRLELIGLLVVGGRVSTHWILERLFCHPEERWRRRISEIPRSPLARSE